ncbi:hypothetical protein LCGC14_0546000 [marine sediment metagenome]|uniref:Uncharacterized protein n=1 Tax=marine sediment metagenome TaxID=412755 RepID=A0A0F9RRD7_9ZZZZ
MENEKQLENIAKELILKSKMMENMPRLSDNDEHNEILQNIKIDEELEMSDYLNR